MGWTGQWSWHQSWWRGWKGTWAFCRLLICREWGWWAQPAQLLLSLSQDLCYLKLSTNVRCVGTHLHLRTWPPILIPGSQNRLCSNPNAPEGWQAHLHSIVSMKGCDYSYHSLKVWGNPRQNLGQTTTQDTLRREGGNRTRLFERKPKESSNEEPPGVGLHSIYTRIHAGCARLSVGLCTVHDIIVERRARLYDLKGGSVHSTRHRSRLL